MAKYLYPAIFKEEGLGGHHVHFPDIPQCGTSGKSLDDAFQQAQKALAKALYQIEEEFQEIPKPTDLRNIVNPDGFISSYIGCDTELYRKSINQKAVKKTLTIPGWLDVIATRQQVNFSAILKEALIQHLGLEE